MPSDDPQMAAPPQQIPEFYTNAMGAQGGLYDVTLEFGRRVGGSEDFEWTARVTMAWEHLRSTVDVLQKVLDRYEQEIGPVRNIEEAIREPEESSP